MINARPDSGDPSYITGNILGVTSVGTVGFDVSKGGDLVILLDSRHVRSAYPLVGSIQNYL